MKIETIYNLPAAHVEGKAADIYLRTLRYRDQVRALSPFLIPSDATLYVNVDVMTVGEDGAVQAQVRAILTVTEPAPVPTQYAGQTAIECDDPVDETAPAETSADPTDDPIDPVS